MRQVCECCQNANCAQHSCADCEKRIAPVQQVVHPDQQYLQTSHNCLAPTGYLSLITFLPRSLGCRRRAAISQKPAKQYVKVRLTPPIFPATSGSCSVCYTYATNVFSAGLLWPQTHVRKCRAIDPPRAKAGCWFQTCRSEL